MRGKKIRSGSTNDILVGTANDDTIHGGGGSDLLYGGDGNDVIVAGQGHDQMHGGNGADRFVFAKTNSDYDTVMDFRADQGDKIYFVGAISPREIAWFDTDLGIEINYGGLNGNAVNHSTVLLLNVHTLPSDGILIG